MSMAEKAGYFFPSDSGDVVLVRGSFNGWGESDSLDPSALEPGVWEATIPIKAAQGDFIEFKYYIKAGTGNQGRVPNGGWESGANRIYTFTADSIQQVERDYFNRLGPQDYVQKPKGVEVHFFVNMKGATDRDGNPFTSIDSIFISGSHPPLFWIWDHPDWDRSHLKLNDSGQYPDETAGDSVWSIAITFPQWTPKGPIQFKFAVNGPVDNEAGFQEDHILFLDDLPEQTGDKAVNVLEEIAFGRQRGKPVFSDTVSIVEKYVVGVKETGEVPLTYALHQNYPNPFNPVTTIKYSIPNTERVVLKVYNILGQEVITLVDEEQRPGVYEIKFNASNLSSGVYLYRLQAGKFVDVKKMMLVK
jgi:hypothetical protein